MAKRSCINLAHSIVKAPMCSCWLLDVLSWMSCRFYHLKWFDTSLYIIGIGSILLVANDWTLFLRLAGVCDGFSVPGFHKTFCNLCVKMMSSIASLCVLNMNIVNFWNWSWNNGVFVSFWWSLPKHLRCSVYKLVLVEQTSLLASTL